jgi:hypothetical protein
MSDKIITLTTFTYPTEAYPLMTRLEEEGIECFLADENIISVNPFLSNAVGGVKVNIKEEDAEQALQILKEIKDNVKKVDKKWAEDFEPVDTYCPVCESHQVFTDKVSFLKNILSGLSAKKLYCADCGNEWEE